MSPMSVVYTFMGYGLHQLKLSVLHVLICSDTLLVYYNLMIRRQCEECNSTERVIARSQIITYM